MRYLLGLLITLACCALASGDEARLRTLTADFDERVRPFVQKYCLGCHGKDKQEAKLTLAPFENISTVRADLGHWELVLTRVKAGEMPPSDAAEQPTKELRASIVGWIEELRAYEASRNAGDPGPVLARRLNNTEYDNTVRDLTGVDLRPTREFPVDPANPAGFANSGESLAMSPALFSKYLAAARHIADHLVLTPSGFAFAPHPALTYSDRDRFATRRIVDFYLAQNTDYADFLLAAWRYQHRDVLDNVEPSLDAAAKSQGVSPKYLATLWRLLNDGENDHGPVAELRERWGSLPTPSDETAEPPIDQCREIRDWIIEQRQQREFSFPSVMIPKLNPTTQPGVLWKNRLIEEHRRQGTMSDDEQQDDDLRRAIERFCDVFPDMFVRTERGRMNLPFEKQNKGRLLGAGFHLQVGYYRDDRPLYEMVLSEEQQQRLDEMWRELFFITDARVRQFQDYLYFERAEGREVITEAEFDFVRAEDRRVTSPQSMAKIARLYVAAVRERELSEEALAEIAKYYAVLSKQIQTQERALVAAEPVHLQSLLQFAAKAWRRPLSADEGRGLLKFYRELREDSDLSHEDAVRDAVTSVLASPLFCYRVDHAGENDRLTSFAVANRLSYFLWSSMPDEQLWSLAEADRLQDTDVLREQVARMLRDRRSRALAIEFAGNWLDFRHFQDHVGVDRTKFPQFTDELREAMFQEPVVFIHDLIQRDGSVRELLQANHTYVDKNLAEHYGIPISNDVTGDRWMRVDDAREYGRGGLLPMAVFLTKSSPGLRTSPVKRGYWVVKQLLGEHIPAPPADVPELPEDEADLGDLTLREVLAKHREVESCAVCHAKFDFAGLVFEGFGPIGERREHDLGGKPVDTTTEFPDGAVAQGLAGLKAYLLKHRQAQFDDNLCRKLLAYGLGRSLQLSDEGTIEEMKQAIAENDGRFSSLIEVIVTSRQFLNKRPDEAVAQTSPSSGE